MKEERVQVQVQVKEQGNKQQQRKNDSQYRLLFECHAWRDWRLLCTYSALNARLDRGECRGAH
jgi:hypothetical protein